MIRKNKNKTKINKKMRGGWTKITEKNDFKNEWDEVVFDDTEINNIKEYKNNNPNKNAVDALNELFPELKNEEKQVIDNATNNIRNIMFPDSYGIHDR